MFKRLAQITILIAFAALVWLILSVGSGKQVQPFQLLILLGALFFYLIISKRAKNSSDEERSQPSTRRQHSQPSIGRQRKGHRSWIRRIDQD